MPSAKVMQTRIICTKELCRSSPTKNSCCFFHPADSSARAKNCFSNFSMLNLCPDSSTTQQKLQLHYEVAHQQSFSRPKLPALHSTGWTAEISHRISCLITSRESMLLQRFFERRYFSLNYAMSKCVELWNVFFIASLVAVKVDERVYQQHWIRPHRSTHPTKPTSVDKLLNLIYMSEQWSFHSTVAFCLLRNFAKLVGRAKSAKSSRDLIRSDDLWAHHD